MLNLYKFELLKYRAWTLVTFSLAFLVFVILQYLPGGASVPSEPLKIYAIAGGIVLGLVQMLLHTRGNNWTYLIHRPLTLPKIFASLIGAGLSIIFVSLAMPLILTTMWRDVSTVIGVDVRAYGSIAFIYLLGSCFYLISCLVILNKSKGVALLYLSFGILLISYTPSSTLTQFLPPIALILILLYLNYTSFKADLSEYDKRPSAIILMSLSISITTTIILTFVAIAVYGVTSKLVQNGSSGQLKANTYTYFEHIETPQARLSYALDIPNEPDAQHYVNQDKLADDRYVRMVQLSFPYRGQITGDKEKISFADNATKIRWVFSHDKMLLEGFYQNTKSPAGLIGKRGFIDKNEPVQLADRFKNVPIILGDKFLQTEHTIYRINYKDKLLQIKHQASAGERYINTPQEFKPDVLLATDKRILLFKMLDFVAENTPLVANYDIPYPVNYRHIDGLNLYRYVEGYVFLFHGEHFYGHNKPGVETFHANLGGSAEKIKAQAFTSFIEPAWYRQKQELISPLILYAIERFSHWVHPASMENSSPSELQQRFKSLTIYWHILILQLFSLMGGFMLCRFHRFGKKQTLTWVALTGIIGLPALLSFFLLNPWRPEYADIPLVDNNNQPNSKLGALSIVSVS